MQSLLVVSLLLLAPITAYCQGRSKPPVPMNSTSIREVEKDTTDVARKVTLWCSPRGHRCKGFGGSCLVLFPEARWRQWLSERREKENTYPAFEGFAELRGENLLYFEFRTAPPKKIRVIPVDQDVQLEKSVAVSLGFESVTVLRGSYRIVATMGNFGGVMFNVRVSRNP